MNSYGFRSHGSPIRFFLLVVAGCAAVGPGRPSAAWAAPEPVTAIDERGRDGVTFIVELPELRRTEVEIAGRSFTAVTAMGFGLTADPGLPMLPFRTFTIAVPPGYEPVPQVRVLESQRLDLVPAPSLDPEMHVVKNGDEEGVAVPGFREVVDEDFYYASTRTYPTLRFAAASISHLRQQRVFDLTVYPVRYDAGARQLQVSRRLEVRVDFRPQPGAAKATRLPAATRERGFESIYRGTIVNYQNGRSWRQGPTIRQRGPARSAQLENREWKIKVRETGLQRVAFGDLPGFETGVPIDQPALFEKRYVDGEGIENFVADPVAIAMTDANGNDVFDAGDSFIFFGRNHRDRFGPEPYVNRYTDDNVYWLTWVSGGGVRVTSSDGWPGHAAPIVPASFADTVHVEIDLFNFDYAPHSIVSPAYAARERVNPWYMTRNMPRALGRYPDCTFVDPNCFVEPDQYNSCSCAASDFPFELHGLDTSATLKLRALMVSAGDGFNHMATFSLFNGAGGETPVADQWSFSGHLAMGQFESDPLPGDILTEGTNTVRFRGERTQEGSSTVWAGALAHLDWCEILYAHRYTAHGNLLACDSGDALGDIELRIGGFTAPGIVVFDLSDPTAPAELTGTQITGSGGSYEVRFQDTVSSKRRYLAFVPGGSELAPLSIVEDAPSNLASPALEPDLIMITHDDFVDDVQPLKEHRESQGHTVEVARISDVYDEFDGGVERAFAIRNYLRHAFREWSVPPLYLLLVGDGNEDYKNLFESGINRVPSQLIYGPVRGDIDLEIIATDTWFVAGLGPEDEEFDLHLDMYVGRLPAQTSAECQDLVEKILAYEEFEATDRWRARTLTIADDDWSSSISFNDVYRQRSSEMIFERIPDVLNEMVNEEYGGLIETRAWKLRTYSDMLPEAGRLPGTVTSHIDTLGLPTLYQLISDGNLIMAYQGHANRHLLAHEWIFSSEHGHHQDQFNNVGRPSIWFLFACHPNDFDEVEERVADQVGGRERSIGELLMEIPQAGLVASLASTGFEWLPGGAASGPPFQYDLNTPIWEAFFKTPPVEEPGGNRHESRWILGEVVHHAKQIYNQRDSFKGPIFSYVLLGDPALRMDAIAPTFSVTAADTLRQNGDRLEVYGTDSDTVLIVVDIQDEVRIDAVEVLEVELLDGTSRPVVDPALVTIDTLGTGGMRPRHLEVRYRAPIRPGSYDIIVRARDASGRLLEHALAVRSDVSVKVDGVTFQEGDFVTGSAALEVDIHTPVPVTADAIELYALENGSSVSPLANMQTVQQDAIGKDWKVSGDLELQGGDHSLVLELSAAGALTLDRRWAFHVTGSGELALQQVAVYPNPFDQQTTFNYQLTNWADEVQIRVYTISGRLVAEIEGTRNAGYSQVIWDGRDRDHDPIANGVYIYRIQASGGGRDDAQTGRIIRSRR